jgi:predicted O-methyltransferase YrrM
MESEAFRSRRWTDHPGARYWWHRLPGMDYVPAIYSDLAEEEWIIVRDWYNETDANGRIGECAVPLISFLHGLIMGSRADRIVQLGTCSGYSTLLIGFMLRRMNAQRGLFTLDYDPVIVAMTEQWLRRAGLDSFVRNAELLSTNPASLEEAVSYLGHPPELIILDTSHQYQATLDELNLWYPLLAPGGIFLLHDVSRFAEQNGPALIRKWRRCCSTATRTRWRARGRFIRMPAAWASCTNPRRRLPREYFVFHRQRLPDRDHDALPLPAFAGTIARARARSARGGLVRGGEYPN